MNEGWMPRNILQKVILVGKTYRLYLLFPDAALWKEINSVVYCFLGGIHRSSMTF